MYYALPPDDQDLKQIELLYWRGVEDPGRINSYAKELLDWLFHGRARLAEIAPKAQIKWADYNVNKRSDDYKYNPRRIDTLRGHKLDKKPLIIFNYDGPGFLVGSDDEFRRLQRRIEIERLKHKFKVIEYLL